MVARSDDAKLNLLAKMDYNPVAELVMSNGNWDLDTVSAYKLVFASRKYNDFSRESDFTEVASVFRSSASADAGSEKAKNAKLKLLFHALRGLSFHLQRRYVSRDEPTSQGRATLGPGVGLMIKRSFPEVEYQVRSHFYDRISARMTKRFSQESFVNSNDLRPLDFNASFGIATHWCLRIIVKGKKSFGTAKAKDALGNATARTSESARMVKKAPFIYHLQSRKDLVSQLNEKESIPVDALILEDVRHNTGQRVKGLHALYEKRAALGTKNIYSSVQGYINLKSMEYRGVEIKKLRRLPATSGNKFFYCRHPGSSVLTGAINRISQELSAAGRHAYIVCFETGTRNGMESGSGALAPYFLESKVTGHAMGISTDGLGSWTFMDPNFGEVHRATRDQIMILLGDALSFYSVVDNIREFVVLEIVKNQLSDEEEDGDLRQSFRMP